MEPHRKSINGSNKTAPSASTSAEQLQQGFLAFFPQVHTLFRILSICTTSFVEQHCFCSVKHLSLDEDIEAMPCRCLGLFFAWRSFLSLVLVGQSTGEKHEKMKRRQIYHNYTSTSSSFHASLWTIENQRPSIDICTIRNSPELGTNLAQLPSFCLMMRH